MKILVIEDDPTTGAYIADGLRREGHAVDLIADGPRG
jgi:two-component system, OmpR family, response regulator